MALKVEMQDAILLNTVNTEVLVCIIWTVWLKKMGREIQRGHPG